MTPALLIIDVQNGIDENAHWGGNRNNPNAEINIDRLLSFWRAKQFPVIVVVHDSSEPSSPLRPGQNGNDLKSFVVPMDVEPVVRKSTANAFIGTSLDQMLKENEITDLYLTGFVTNNSIEATARMAGDLGFRTTVISDATACFDKVGLDGTRYPSELVHQLSLANLSDEYATIADASLVINTLSRLAETKPQKQKLIL